MIYQSLPGIQSVSIGQRPVLVTPQGGKVALDAKLLAFWQTAQGRSDADILALFPNDSPELILAAVACLCEAGLLLRQEVAQPSRVMSAPSNTPELQCAGRVSVIVVGYNSREWLDECIPSLLQQTLPPAEIIFVDNASSDGTAQMVAERYPQVRLLTLENLVPLSRALNLGAALAQGDFLLLLNPDLRLEPDALAHMVCVAQADPHCAAVATKLRFWWAPGFLNGIGNMVGPVSWGTDLALGHLDLGQFDHLNELPSACFAATLIPRSAWQAVGPLDEAFPMYYEDSEWCYRARLLGFTVRAAAQAVAYHAYGGRVPSSGGARLSSRKLRHVTYGRLRFAAKLCGARRLQFVGSYLLMDCLGLAAAAVRLKKDDFLARIHGWRDFWQAQPELRTQRTALQARRAIPDATLFHLPQPVPPPFIWRGLPELTWELIRTHYLPLIQAGKTRPMPEFTTERPRLLLISNDIVDAKMAGPGLRYLEMARALGADLTVTLAIPGETTLQIPGLHLVAYDPQNPAGLKALCAQHDILLVSSFLVEKLPFLQQTDRRLVVDLYDPTVLENLYYYRNEPLPVQDSLNQQGVAFTNRLARLGDFFICGNPRQRDYWLGVLTANGRLNPHTFGQDDSLLTLIDVVGVGLPERLPQARPFVKGIHPQVGADTRIVLWGGGIWDWLDPLTLVDAWPQVIAAHPEARLIFLGTRHPNPLVPRHAMAERTERRAAEIGEKDRSILFFEWLSVEDREALLCEADVGVLLHPVHVETRYSIRTRVLDYLWARLPVLITAGDVTSEWVQQYGVGAVVPPYDAAAVGRALGALLDQPKQAWAEAFTPLCQTYQWAHVVEPLRRYALHGLPAADRDARRADRLKGHQASAWRWQISKAWYLLRREGLKTALLRLWRYVQWRLSTRE